MKAGFIAVWIEIDDCGPRDKSKAASLVARPYLSGHQDVFRTPSIKSAELLPNVWPCGSDSLRQFAGRRPGAGDKGLKTRNVKSLEVSRCRFGGVRKGKAAARLWYWLVDPVESCGDARQEHLGMEAVGSCRLVCKLPFTHCPSYQCDTIDDT
jgi:hypothetical protein